MRGRTRIAYLVHDLNDAAVARRILMLRAGGAEVTVAGFRRDERVPESVAGARAVDLGRTGDARLAQRAAMVAANTLRPARLRAAVAGADVVVARNLEMLALAASARRVVPGARLVYECLDIHRMLLGRSLPARAVQAIEARLLRSVDLLLVSSPAFLREYFDGRSTLTAPALLVENKLLALGDAPPAPSESPPGPPWTIGWFGNLRCRRTFDVLSELAQKCDGRVRVLIAGRPSPAVFADLPAMVAATPHLDYHGPFAPDDLPALYARCHFAWAIDWFEEGLNSSWLLPNRLYEASGYGAVPIALAGVETGRWLAGHRAGLLIEGDPRSELAELFERLDMPAYLRLRDAVAAIPSDALVATTADCESLVDTVAGR
ncbi:hypothetical protein [uncultured Sphingomonas sp.]|uniref:hypothetical protein n=1 Tax=uncultured Sphingomonas sp. TaxID=158754 RepID=UPI0035CAA36E